MYVCMSFMYVVYACVYVCMYCMYVCDVCMYVSKSAAAQSATVLENVISQVCSASDQEAVVQRSFSSLRLERCVGAKRTLKDMRS